MSRYRYRDMTNDELYRALAHARNRRDAYAEGREPQEVLTELRRLLDEQERRRTSNPPSLEDRWQAPGVDEVPHRRRVEREPESVMSRCIELRAAVDQAQATLDRHRAHMERLVRYHDECPDGDPRKANVERDMERVQRQIREAEAAANVAVDALLDWTES